MNLEIAHELIGMYLIVLALVFVLALGLGVIKVWYGIRRKW